MSTSEPLRCLEHGDDCSGSVEHRMPLSSTGKSFPRCDRHWELRLEEQERINARYPEHAPSDFDPLDAGETWSDDDDDLSSIPGESPDPYWMNP
jgi:hypothetical protein